MKKIFFFAATALALAGHAQMHSNHHHFESKSASGIITDHKKLSNGNTLQSMIIDDSTRLYPGAQLCYAESVVKNPGSLLTLTSSNNSQVWTKNWFPVNYMNDFFYIETFYVDPSGDIYLSGRFSGVVDLDPGPATVMYNSVFQNAGYGFLIKLDSNGNYLWSKILNNPSNVYQFCNIYSLLALNNGHLLCSGTYSETVDFDPGVGVQTRTTPAMATNGFLLELDMNGNFVQVATLASSSSSAPGAPTQDNAGNTYLVCSFSGTIDIDPTAAVSNFTAYESYYNSCLIKYDSLFNPIWSKHFDPDFGYPFVRRLDDQNIYIVSNFVDTALLNNNTSVIAQGYADMAVERWDSAGNCIWSKTITGAGDVYTSDFRVHNNALYLYYFYDDSLYTNTGVNDTALYAQNYDIALTVLANTGDHLQTLELKSDSATYNYWGQIDFSSLTTNINYYTDGIIDLEPFPAVVNDFSQSSWNTGIVGIVELMPLTLGSNALSLASNPTLQAYPNPADDDLNIVVPTNGTLTVVDLYGQTVFVENVYAKQVVLWNTTTLASGVYFLRLEDEFGKISPTQKIVVQHR